MKPTARDLIEAQHDVPGDADRPPGRPPGRPDRPMMRQRLGGPDGGPMRGPGGIGPMGAPRGDFNPRELSQMKDFMLLELVRGQGSFYASIVQKLVTGQELEPGQLQHFIDEVGNIEGMPESMQMLVQKIQQVLATKQ